MLLVMGFTGISIHAPRGRGDLVCHATHSFLCTFQSTPLAGGATSYSLTGHGTNGFQSTPLAGGATLAFQVIHKSHQISIHAPRGRGDRVNAKRLMQSRSNFNPRPSREGRHQEQRHQIEGVAISIHAPRGRGDREFLKELGLADISIHAPRGRGDMYQRPNRRGLIVFQSTPLAGGATAWSASCSCTCWIFQSTPLAGGATHCFRLCLAKDRNFNPRPSREGRRRFFIYASQMQVNFNPRPSREGRHHWFYKEWILDTISIHAPRGRGDRAAGL